MLSTLTGFERLHAVVMCSRASHLLPAPFSTQGSLWVSANIRANPTKFQKGRGRVKVLMDYHPILQRSNTPTRFVA